MAGHSDGEAAPNRQTIADDTPRTVSRWFLPDEALPSGWGPDDIRLRARRSLDRGHRVPGKPHERLRLVYRRSALRGSQ
jgi:hypothetical protein